MGILQEENTLVKEETLLTLLQKQAFKESFQTSEGFEFGGPFRGFAYADDNGKIINQLSFQQLEAKAKLVAKHLQQYNAQGERVVLLYPSGLDFIVAFFGCIYAGSVAVPVCVEPPKANLPRIDAIIVDSEAKFALTTSAINEQLQACFLNPFLGGFALRKTKLLLTDTLQDIETPWKEPSITPNDLAYLQVSFLFHIKLLFLQLFIIVFFYFILSSLSINCYFY
jgi:long-subunit acyl-CoA synthetase (AMP-forming)